MTLPYGARVLVVDDEPAIQRAVETNLRRHDFRVEVVDTGGAAIDSFDRSAPDVVLLDLGLPDMDGLDVIRAIRARGAIPIVVLSVRGAERDKVAALDLGADDYLTKPFGVEELLARILATLRRTRPATEAPAEAAPTVITIGDLRIDLASQQVRLAGAEVHLTPTEFALLRELAVNRGKLLSRTHLLRRVWGHGYETETEYVRVYIRRLRAKLEPPGSPPLIVTQPRAGYRIPAE